MNDNVVAAPLNDSGGGEIVIVTGGSSGIGLATAHLLVSLGYMVISADLTEPPQDFKENGGSGSLLPTTIDVSSETQVKELFTQVDEFDAPLKAVINCAGITHRATLEHTSFHQWRKVLAVNLDGTFLMSREGVIRFLKNGGGTIINLASAAAVVPVKSVPAYAASKAGVLMLSRQTALDYAESGIRVYAVCPTGVDTPLIARRFEASQDPIAARSAYVRDNGPLLSPDSIAKTIAHLLRDDSPPPGPTALVY